MRINVLLEVGVPLEVPTHQVQVGHGNMHGQIWARVTQVQARLRQAVAQVQAAVQAQAVQVRAALLAVQVPLHPAEAAPLMTPGMHPQYT